ncbi:hypothetical protein AAC387_Pa01g3041 [Persea americana]
MGNSLACLCSHSSKGGVLVMKENGDFIKFRRRVLVKEVEGAYPGYKIIRCGSDGMVLPESDELDSSRLYFLIPEKLVRCNYTYEKFVRMAESKGLIPCSDGLILMKARKEIDQMEKDGSSVINGQVMVGQMLLFEVSELRNSAWKPDLQTIPEVVSP